MAITAKIAKHGIYTSYAEGKILSSLDKGNYYEIKLSEQSIIILYYHFNFHRRVYICCIPEKLSSCKLNHPILKFHNVDKNLTVIAELQGRAFDRFKRMCNVIKNYTNGRFYDYSILFFSKLAFLCRYGKNSMVNIKNLCKIFDFTLQD